MSADTFRAGERLRAAKMNRALSEAAANGALAAAALSRDMAAKPISDFYPAIDRNGSQPTQSVINDCIQQYAGAGSPVGIGPGNYRNTGSIQLISNAQVLMSPNARLLQYFSTTGSHAFFEQVDYNSRLPNVRIQGGQVVNADPSLYTGNVWALNLTDSIISDLFVDERHDSGRFGILRGLRNRIERVHAVSTHDGGGIILHDSDRTRVSDCYVECGDDCYQLGIPQSLDASITNCEYINCTGRSWNARMMIAGAVRAGVEPALTASITDCAFIGIRGVARRMATVANTLSSGKIARIDFVSCAVDCIDDNTGGSAAITLADEVGSGGIEDIRFLGGGLINPYQSVLENSSSARRVYFRGFYFGAPRTTRETIRLDGNMDVSVMDSTIECRPDANGARIGADATGGTRTRWRDNSFIGISDGWNGLNIASSARCEIGGNHFVEANGSTTARAFNVGTGATNVLVGRNDYSSITVADKFLWPVTANTGSAIDTTALQTITSNHTARIHQSGTTFVLTSSGARNITLPACRANLRFRGVQQGSGALTFVAATGDVIQVGASVSTAGGTATSGTVGATLDLVGLDDTTWIAESSSGTWTVST